MRTESRHSLLGHGPWYACLYVIVGDEEGDVKGGGGEGKEGEGMGKGEEGRRGRGKGRRGRGKGRRGRGKGRRGIILIYCAP